MTAALKLFWSGERGDNFSTATAQGERDALAAGYVLMREEGLVETDPQPGMSPLKLFWSGERGDNFSTATAQGERDALAAGYQFLRVEGFVHTEQRPGTVPLRLFWSNERGDNFSTATAQGERDALAAGYQFLRVEGFLSPNPTGASAIRGISERDFGGGKHGMVDAVLDGSGKLTVTTRTWTNSPFQGFTMGVKAWVVDRNGGLIHETTGGPGPYGVDGRNVPFGSASERTDLFVQKIDPTQATDAAEVRLAIFHAPKWRIAEIVSQAGDIAADLKGRIDEFCRKNPELCALVKGQVLGG